MLFAAGLETVEDIAKLTPSELMQLVAHVNTRQAEQITKAAKASVMESIENHQDRLEELKETIGQKKFKHSRLN